MSQTPRIQRPIIDEALSEQDEQRFHAQRLEAIGRLAGGVAHDFNNLLTAIIGYSDLLLKELTNNSARNKVEEIRKAGWSAACLSRQLLAFGRRQVLQSIVLDLNVAVRDVSGILQRLIGEDIELVSIAKAKHPEIWADPGQIEQVIVNLAANARDAMPNGGALTIETENVYLDENYASQYIATEPGNYVMLAVTDSGCGMDTDTQEKIFEPFFTTKEKGKGTGLGLATVYGIVKQLGGNIWVYSEPGEGTTFKVYFPWTNKALTKMPERPAPHLARGQGATVLLVEDDTGVRRMAEEVLVADGYQVLVAENGRDALELCAHHQGKIDLLLTDVVMPGISAAELVQKCVAENPEMRVVYMSGYTDETVVRRGILEKNVEFLQKPFGPDELTRKVGATLELDAD
ncbi:MAG TPA: ATP-binding protein [Pyrinomonadaceae bacterium]|jgi:nitrogen-specific signal transduction histidine kinase/ActR/RegA family two-component response regulator